MSSISRVFPDHAVRPDLWEIAGRAAYQGYLVTEVQLARLARVARRDLRALVELEDPQAFLGHLVRLAGKGRPVHRDREVTLAQWAQTDLKVRLDQQEHRDEV